MSFAPIQATPSRGKKQQHNGLQDNPARSISRQGVLQSQSDANRARWKPINITELVAPESPPWIWFGLAAKGYITLFLGLWKSGKSTLLAHLIRAMGKTGECIGGEIFPAKVLYISEESPGHWKRRRDELQIDRHVEMIFKPFRSRATRAEWEDFIRYLAELIAEEGFQVVVFDTISKMWPVRNENDSSEVDEAMLPMIALTEAGAAVLIVHHPRKGDATEAQASRGSGALPAAVDMIVEFRRLNPEDRFDRRRVLSNYGRWDEAPPEIVIELTDEGYKTIGTKSESSRSDRLQVVAEILSNPIPSLEGSSVPETNVNGALRVEHILERWGSREIPKPGKRTLLSDLEYGVEAGMLMRAGEGVKHSPYVFYLSIRFRQHQGLKDKNEALTNLAMSTCSSKL